MSPSRSLASLIAAVAAIGFACSAPAFAHGSNDPDATALSFVAFGCNRVNPTDTTGDPSTANVAELQRTLADIAQLDPKPRYLFFIGDEVLGYTADTVRLASELQAWRTLYEASPLPAAGVQLVAIPGNHETQTDKKVAAAANERTFLRVMAPYIAHGGNGPTAGGPDGFTTDQSKLSYSFTDGTTHFIVMNTDPTGLDAHAPTRWAQADIAAARAAGATHIFVFGHKPAYPYPTEPTDGLSINAAARDSFWTVLGQGGVDAMIAAHNHVYYRSQPTAAPTLQIIAGNGGSKLDSGLDPSMAPTGEYYGFTQVAISNSGMVTYRSYGRDVPTAGYTASVASENTTVRDSVVVGSR